MEPTNELPPDKEQDCVKIVVIGESYSKRRAVANLIDYFLRRYVPGDKYDRFDSHTPVDAGIGGSSVERIDELANQLRADPKMCVTMTERWDNLRGDMDAIRQRADEMIASQTPTFVEAVVRDRRRHGIALAAAIAIALICLWRGVVNALYLKDGVVASAVFVAAFLAMAVAIVLLNDYKRDNHYRSIATRI